MNESLLHAQLTTINQKVQLDSIFQSLPDIYRHISKGDQLHFFFFEVDNLVIRAETAGTWAESRNSNRCWNKATLDIFHQTLDLSFQKAYVAKHFLQSECTMASFDSISAMTTLHNLIGNLWQATKERVAQAMFMMFDLL